MSRRLRAITWFVLASTLVEVSSQAGESAAKTAESGPAAKSQPSVSQTLSRELSQFLARRFPKTPADRRREADQLLKLHAKVLADKRLSTTERDRWLVRLKGRLTRIAGDIRRDLAAARGGAAQDDGQALVELIEATIAPQSWDVNGGQGTIRYWPNWHVLVVRQSDDVHEQIGGVGDMRH